MPEKSQNTSLAPKSPPKRNIKSVPPKNRKKGRKNVLKRKETPKSMSKRGFRSEKEENCAGKPVLSEVISRLPNPHKAPPKRDSDVEKTDSDVEKTESDTDSDDVEFHSSSDETDSDSDTELKGTAGDEDRAEGSRTSEKVIPGEEELNPPEREKKKRRYILFLGNLPITVTREDVVSHFEKRGVPVREFRLLTHKDTGKSKGCGFMELSGHREIQNAIKLHRSRLMGKHLNVEVTCGGGGKTEARRKRILEKNRTMRKKNTIGKKAR